MRIVIVYSVLLLLLATVASASPGALELNGNFTQGGLVFGRTAPGNKVFYAGKQLKLTPDGRFIVGFGRDAASRQVLTLVTADGYAGGRIFQIAQRHYRIERIHGISKQMMQPNQEELQRIGQEAELVAAARKVETGRLDFLTSFSWPVIGRISGVYGSQRILNGEPRRPHFGIDIAAPAGTRVNAPADGVVRMVHQGMFFSGKTLVIDHGYGLSSSYLHLKQILVEEGQQIKQGDPIATVGATGRVTGPHLDWRINWFERRLDPELLVSDLPGG